MGPKRRGARYVFYLSSLAPISTRLLFSFFCAGRVRWQRGSRPGSSASTGAHSDAWRAKWHCGTSTTSVAAGRCAREWSASPRLGGCASGGRRGGKTKGGHDGLPPLSFCPLPQEAPSLDALIEQCVAVVSVPLTGCCVYVGTLMPGGQALEYSHASPNSKILGKRLRRVDKRRTWYPLAAPPPPPTPKPRGRVV